MRIIFILSLLMLMSCNSTKNQNRVENTDVEKYTLTKDDFKNFKNYLNDNHKILAKDTIIIKYEFNNESCWDRLDREENSRIQYFIDLHQKEIEKFNSIHKNAVALHFREEGKNFNKVVFLDKSIFVDQSSFLKSLIFKEKNMCGNTIIMLKDGTYYLRKSDPHFDIIQVMNKSEKHD
jgi:hypothetical protein